MENDVGLKHLNEFINIKAMLERAKILDPCDPETDIIIITDAFYDDVEAVLWSQVNGK